mmetsp:Transcript_20151/g.14587  ORF Transcript_20151/g.14587 Transcript_20151/m.14587 type:complete len:110 (+) Transcript_20151:993-1322(+)|eukprot:CAMPEP_0116871528 /NCGR_PEP_ID=MMETSP0463-20121206/1919_1 /TAXON_ID=181622 /ORGANISM="Strombidinopsis sp, Strain SopsisLIS2011" /LENGTH=109 /DNA_ID=CAMNT_0004510121 /DNA_START=907 /DNA_END=1236 /DNA_ORIENTATION=+
MKYHELLDAFKAIDKNNTGKLNLQEIKQAFAGYDTEDHLKEVFEAIDLKHNGVIDYEEFLVATVDKDALLTQDNLEFAFHHFDVSNTGFITKEDLVEAFKRQGEHIPDD